MIQVIESVPKILMKAKWLATQGKRCIKARTKKTCKLR